MDTHDLVLSGSSFKPKTSSHRSNITILMSELLFFSVLFSSSSLAANAQESQSVNRMEIEQQEIWDVANPPLPKREISIKVSEGTWMSLDVSPDGKTIAFDLLGDIYTIPITGGKATNISSGLPWEIQPRFSPDGTKIAFISDREGGDNIWTMNIDGSEARSLTKEKFRMLNNPTWSADGNYIAARKHFTTWRSNGTGEIWLYHVRGGSGLALVKRSSESFQKELGEPIFSPDGRYLYYTKNITSGDIFTYAQDSNTDLFNILRLDLNTGEIDHAVSGEGGALRAAPSPDGKSIAFVRRERMRSMLYIKNIASGKETRLYDDLDRDMQETWGMTGMYPNMDWTPDSKSIVFWAKGKIHMVEVDSAAVTPIPFSVDDSREVIDPPRPKVMVAPKTFEIKMPRFAKLAPDGSQVVFESLGKLWLKSAHGGDATRLTRDSNDRRELFPSWSSDSRSIVFVSWDDEDLGAIRTISATGSRERKLTQEPGHYRRPRFSPNEKIVVFEKGSGGLLTSGNWSESPGIYTVSTAGGNINKVINTGNLPHFARENDRIWFTRRGITADLVSVDLSGQNERLHATAKLVSEYQVAPNGEHFAFMENYDAHVMPLLDGPHAVPVGRGSTALPQVEISGNGATYLHWTSDGMQVNWSLGSTLYSVKVDELHQPIPAVVDNDVEPKKSSIFSPPVNGLDLSFEATSDMPQGIVALVGARVISMSNTDGGVIDGATILVEGNRISAIGKNIDVPNNARVVNVEGKTILPGLIDAHAHGPQGDDEIIPQQNWSTIAHLAMGVTTTYDPANRGSHIFAAAEYQKTGNLLAPRIYSTGKAIYGAKAPGLYAHIDNYGDAKEHVFRLSKQGAHSVKNYNQPRRDQRQQVVAAAIEAGMAVVAEGAANYHMSMSMAADGNTSIEHNLPQEMIYEDVLSMYSQTNVALTPALVVSYGGLGAKQYWRQATDVWLHPILSKHVPPRFLQAQTVRRTKAPEEDFVDASTAKAAHMLAKRGVMISIGGHGEQQGLAAHWEIWSFERGGFSAIEALATATINPAKHLGFDQDIGSLEVGKLADLLILNSNPLDNLRNTGDIDKVMLNGRLYDAATMNEELSDTRVQEDYFWQ